MSNRSDWDGPFFLLCKDSRSFQVWWTENQSPWEELAVVQREIDKFLKNSEKEARECQNMSGSQEESPKIHSPCQAQYQFSRQCLPGLLVRSIRRSPAQVRYVMSPLFWLQVIVKPSCWTMHNARLRPRYAHSLAERHNLVHATRQNEAGQTCPLLPSSIATQLETGLNTSIALNFFHEAAGTCFWANAVQTK